MVFYTGSFTEIGAPGQESNGKGIGCFRFDELNEAVEPIQLIRTRNPSYLTISVDREYLYAVDELPQFQEPKIFSFKINSDSNLVKLNAQPLKGEYTLSFGHSSKSIDRSE